MYDAEFVEMSPMTLYGNVRLRKQECPECGYMSFVADGKTACCDKVVGRAPTRYQRESEPAQARRLPPKRDRQAQLEHQRFCCAYCDRAFGAPVARDGKVAPLGIHWDHRVPFSYSQDNHAENFLAACHICNMLKSDLCFQTMEEARVFLADRWLRKGYETL